MPISVLTLCCVAVATTSTATRLPPPLFACSFNMHMPRRLSHTLFDTLINRTLSILVQHRTASAPKLSNSNSLQEISALNSFDLNMRVCVCVCVKSLYFAFKSGNRIVENIFENFVCTRN